MNTKKISSVEHMVLSGHTLQRKGGSLWACEIGDLLFYKRALEIEQSNRSDARKFSFWNGMIEQYMTAVVASDLCIVTAYVNDHKYRKINSSDSVILLARRPLYLPVFAKSLKGGVEVTVLSQDRKALHSKNPSMYSATRAYNPRNEPKLCYALKNGALRDLVNEVCHKELRGLVPMGLFINEVKIPISAVFGRRCPRSGRLAVPWALHEHEVSKY